VAGKAAAREALERAWLAGLRTELRGKAAIDVVTLTNSGSAYVMEQVNPRGLLETVQRSLEESSSRVDHLRSELSTCQHHLDALRNRVEELQFRIESSTVTVATVQVTPSAWQDRLAEYLLCRQESRPAEDCPLPELFHQAKNVDPALSVGEFHEGLRRLQADRRIALQPWTGPLHELPEPTLALMHGHSLAYYASPAAQ